MPPRSTRTGRISRSFVLFFSVLLLAVVFLTAVRVLGRQSAFQASVAPGEAVHYWPLDEAAGPSYQDRGNAGGLRSGYGSCEAPVRIMPLGDSITARRGYRRALYAHLVDAGYDIDFVGSRTDKSWRFYDRDHEGYPGYTPADIAALLPDRLRLNPPDIILLHIGTNEEDVAGVESILDIIRAFNPAISVVLARIINHAHPSEAVTQFNDAVATLVKNRQARGDKLLWVDQESALAYPDDFRLPDGGSYDELHPNDSGFSKMAKVWFQALQTLLPVCRVTAPQISSSPLPFKVKGLSGRYPVYCRYLEFMADATL